MPEHKLFAIIKSDISDCICKAINFWSPDTKINDTLLNEFANSYTDKIIERIKENYE